MIFKTLITSILLSILLVTLAGCTLIRIGQESIEKAKTATTYGYQNSIKPDAVRNVKDYIVEENDFVIIAEDLHRTLYKIRNKGTFGKFSMLGDLVDYCEDIKGTVQFGKQFGASIASDFDSIDFEFSSLKSDYRKKRLAGYKGWMRCVNTDDDFEIKRKSRSDYFLITHTKGQLQGYSLRWYMDYYDLEELDLQDLNIGIWSYSTLVQLCGTCIQNKGKATISNSFTDGIETDLNTYFLNQLDPLNGKKAYLLGEGQLSCRYDDLTKKDFIFTIAFSKKYRKLLYTKKL